MDKSKKIKILQVVPNLNVAGGVQKYVYNIIKYIDKEKFQIDVVHHNWQSSKYSEDKTIEAELKKMGCKIFSVPDVKKGYKQFLAAIDEVYTKCKGYDIIHVNTMGAAPFFLKKAAQHKFKYRIFQVHETRLSEKLLHRIRNRALLTLSKKYSTHKFSVSKKAGDDIFKNQKYSIVYSCINKNDYTYSKTKRQKVRNMLNISDDDFVVGFVGRFCKQKNVMFVINVFREFLKLNNNAYIIFVGEGPYQKKIQNYAQKHHINERVCFVGQVDNVSDYYSAFDLFLLPSLYEGLGLVAVEAQYTGLPCLLSDEVPKEANIGLAKFLKLNLGANIWAQNIASSVKTKQRSKQNVISRFEPRANVKHISNLYNDILRG